MWGRIHVDNDWQTLVGLAEGHSWISFLEHLLEQDWYPSVWYWLTPLRKRGMEFVASGGSLESFDSMLLCLAIWLEKVDLVCAPEGLVTIVTCSSGEAGNTVTGKGVGEGCTTFWLCIDWFLIEATENGPAGGLDTLIPRVGRALYFSWTNANAVPHHPKYSNHCQLQALAYHGCFCPFDILVSYYWDRWHASLTNLERLKVTIFIFNLKT